MNKTLKFFITLFSILVCTPVFADDPVNSLTPPVQPASPVNATEIDIRVSIPTQQPTKQQLRQAKRQVKRQENATNKDKCENIFDGTWREIEKKCYCGLRVQSMEDGAEKCPKKAEKAQKATDKAYMQDIEELIDAYETVTEKIIKKCKDDGGTITGGECSNANK